MGGLEKVYEIGKIFRNEGVDLEHNPEFTTMESYEALADYNDVMELVEQMVSSVAQDLPCLRGTIVLHSLASSLRRLPDGTKRVRMAHQYRLYHLRARN